MGVLELIWMNVWPGLSRHAIRRCLQRVRSKTHLDRKTLYLSCVLLLLVSDAKCPGPFRTLVFQGNKTGRIYFVIGFLEIVQAAALTVVQDDRGHARRRRRFY